MLEGMRKASQGWVGRIFMALIMGFISLSFAIWGVGDIFRGIGTAKVAEVGETDIPTEAFRNAYQTQLQTMQRQARRAITNDQARALGVDRQVLTRMISEALLDDRAQKFGLAMSEQVIAKSILADQTFAGPDGKFDPNRFQEILRDNGYTELGFAREQRRVYLRQEIVEALAGKLPVPTALLDAVNRYRAETRSVEYFELPVAAAGAINPPAEADLQAFYETRKQAFRAPEYRKVVVLSVTPASLAEPDKVSDADAKVMYDRVKGQRYGTAERRELEQIVFADEKAATDASAAIKGGKSFAEAAADAKLSVVELGTIAKADIFDKAIADAGFSTAQGAVSEPVKGQFGWVLVRVAAISGENVKPLAEVAADLKREIATDRARKTASELRDKIEDERTSGKALTDAAKAVNLTPTVLDGVDASGKDRTGKDVALPDRENVLKAVFASDIGVDNDLLSNRDGGYVWFEVASIDPARERRLDEVKDQVLAAWTSDEISKRLSAKGNDIVKAIKAGQSFEDAAKAAGVEPKRDDKVRRVEPSELPQGAVARVFGIPVGDIGASDGQGQSRLIFKVLDSVTPPLDPDADVMKGLAEQLRSGLAEDVVTQYLARLQTESGVKINEAAVNAAVGGSDPNTF